MNKHIILSSPEKVEAAIQNLNRAADYFTPFAEYLKTFNPALSIEEFRELLYGKPEALHVWIKRIRAEQNPALAKLPATPQRDELAGVSVDELAGASRCWQSTRSNKRIDPRFVYSLTFNRSGALEPSQAALEKITEEFTVYGTQQQAEVLKEAERLYNELEEFKKKYGIPLIGFATQGIININPLDSSIHIIPERVLSIKNG